MNTCRRVSPGGARNAWLRRASPRFRTFPAAAVQCTPRLSEKNCQHDAVLATQELRTVMVWTWTHLRENVDMHRQIPAWYSITAVYFAGKRI